MKRILLTCIILSVTNLSVAGPFGEGEMLYCRKDEPVNILEVQTIPEKGTFVRISGTNVFKQVNDQTRSVEIYFHKSSCMPLGVYEVDYKSNPYMSYVVQCEDVAEVVFRDAGGEVLQVAIEPMTAMFKTYREKKLFGVAGTDWKYYVILKIDGKEYFYSQDFTLTPTFFQKCELRR